MKISIIIKKSFLSCSWKKNSDKLLSHSIHISQKCFEASLKGCASNVGWLKIRLQEPKKAELAGTSRPSQHPESPHFGWEPILHPNYGEIQFWPQLGSFCGSKTSFWQFWGPFWAPRAWFSLSQHWRLNLWGKPQNIIWMKWGSNLSLFFFQEQLRKLIFL